MGERCDCCDLPIETCGKVLEQAQAAEHRARVQRALAEPGAVAAAFPGTCPCGERYPKGTPIKASPDGWYDLLDHPEGLDA